MQPSEDSHLEAAYEDANGAAVDYDDTIEEYEDDQPYWFGDWEDF